MSLPTNKFQLFTNTLDYSNPVALDMQYRNNLGAKHSQIYERYPFAFKMFSEVLDTDVPPLDAASGNAVELELSRAMRERAWIKCLAYYGLASVNADHDSDYRGDIELAKQSTAELLNLPRLTQEATPRRIAPYLLHVHDLQLRRNTRTMLSELALTHFTMGKMTVLEQLMAGEIGEDKELTPEERAAVTSAQKDFGRNGAYGFALLGDQPDTLLEITADGLRAAMAKGGPDASAHADIWLLRVFGAAAQTIVHGSAGEKIDSFGILKEALPFTYSQRRAVTSIRQHP